MKISDVIADMILDMLDDNKATVQIQRNDLAARVGCCLLYTSRCV